MKKSRLFLVCALIILSFSLGVFADEVAEVFFNVAKVQVNGKMTDAPTILYQGTTFVPVRFVSTELGADVQWDAASKTVIIKNKNSEASKSSSWDRKISVEEPKEPEKPQSTFGYPGLNKEPQKPQEPKKDVKADMEKQFNNVEIDVQILMVDNIPAMVVTPMNKSGYTIKKMELEHIHTSGKVFKYRWANIDPQGTGEQQKSSLASLPKGGNMKRLRLSITFSDGSTEHTIEQKYDY